MSKAFYVTLPGRGLVHIEGEDRKAFLQGLVSNDLDRLSPGRILYACLLTPQGKFLHDFFIHEGDGVLLLDCEGGPRAKDLHDRLNKYRLRSKVTLSVEESVPVYAIFGGDNTHGLQDPRDADMGLRAFEKPAGIPQENFAAWDMRRIAIGLPDGSRDMEIEKSTMLECNLDKINAIDWNKGCYMGQELTARMHYRGLAKKHLYPVRITGDAPGAFDDIGNIGNMRSSCADVGLALLKDDSIKDLDNGTYPIRLLG